MSKQFEPLAPLEFKPGPAIPADDGWRALPTRGKTFRVRVEAQERIALCEAARRRGCRPDELLTAIVRTILNDNLITAILDD